MGTSIAPISTLQKAPMAGAGGAQPISPTNNPAPIGAVPGLNPGGVANNNPFIPAGGHQPLGGTPGSPIGINQPVNGPAGGQIGNPIGAVPTNSPTSTVQTNGINWADGSNTVTGDFKDTYGAGTGTALSQVLSGLGTATDSAVSATNAVTEQQANKEYANIRSAEGAAGVTANSSTAGLAAGDFYSGVNAQEQATTAQMELGEENTLISTLTGEGSAHGPDESTMDSIMNGISDAGTIGTSVAKLAMI